MTHDTNSTDEEPITGRVTKAVEGQLERRDRRASDKRFESLKPYLIYIICGIAGAGLLMWREQGIHSEEISIITARLNNLEIEEKQINELASKDKANDAKHEELLYWRRTIEQRIGDLAAIIIEHGKEKPLKDK